MTSYQIPQVRRHVQGFGIAIVVALCLFSALAASVLTRAWTLAEVAAPPNAVVAPAADGGGNTGTGEAGATSKSPVFLNGLPYGGTPNGGR